MVTAPRIAALLLAAGLTACGGGGGDSPAGPSRTYLMGFSAIPPAPDPSLQLPTLELAVRHADAGLLQISIPWTALLAGTSAADEVRAVRLPLADYYRAHDLQVVVALDITDGLDRSQEDPELRAAGRSITEPAIQQLYRDYVLAVDSLLRPRYLSLAAETNLVRLAAPPAVYAAVVAMTNAAAADLRSQGSTSPLVASVQVETAWGGLQGGGYVGIAADRTDFPFVEVLGLSSYPYLAGYATPAALPDDYYARLVEGNPIPVLVLEGGWPSEAVGGIASTPELQADWIRRHAELLARTQARGLFQITLTDLDLAAWPAAIAPFARLGLVDTNLVPKPALAAWDEILAR